MRKETSFFRDIDLIDESLREGLEHTFITPSVSEACKMAKRIIDSGVYSVMIDKLPEKKQRIEVLRDLVKMKEDNILPNKVRFLVLTALGKPYLETVDILKASGINLNSIWVVVNHACSDIQIQHLYAKQMGWIDKEKEEWTNLSIDRRRHENLKWLKENLSLLDNYSGGGVMMGLTDAYRANYEHLIDVIATIEKSGVKEIKLLDTAGTAINQGLNQYVGETLKKFPKMRFFYHFHNDYGMATANAMYALSMGAHGVDVSVGGFGNRAGLPPVAEVVTGLRDLYGVTLERVNFNSLFGLSRAMEKFVGIAERPTQPITGLVTFSVGTGFRTELIKEEATVFDVIEAESVGSFKRITVGISDGYKTISRFLKEEGYSMEEANLFAPIVYDKLYNERKSRETQIKDLLPKSIANYYKLLNETKLSSNEVLNVVREEIKLHSIKS